MNTGVGDAENLAWRLALVASARAGARALADREQCPVDLRLQVIASAATAALVTTITVWAEEDGATALTTLVDDAFEVLAAL